jgi:thymidylate synthase
VTDINVLTPGEAVYWANVLTRTAGEHVSPRGIPTREVQNVTFHVKYPHLSPYLPGRDARHFIGAVEALQLVGQVADPDTVVQGSKAMGAYMDGGIFHGAYGARVYGQLTRAETLLADDPATRQAVVTIYDGPRDLLASFDNDSNVKDTPCTLSLQFMWTPGTRLGLRVSMRSNDVWLGMPYDLFQFTALQMAMADALGVDVGPYVHTVGSLHIYERDIEASEGLQAPGEPLAHETVRQTIAWRGDSIAAISARARAILAGRPIDDPTDYEFYLTSAMEAAR